MNKKNEINIQLFGDACPPYYGIEAILDKVKDILKIDEKINSLFIEREKAVEELMKAVDEENKKSKKG